MLVNSVASSAGIMLGGVCRKSETNGGLVVKFSVTCSSERLTSYHY